MSPRWNTEEDFWRRVERTEGCWLWQGYVMPNGYGQVSFGARRSLAHRIAYELSVGPIPEGLDLDHLCRNRRCVNPDHLEPVTRRVNLLRGETLTAANAAKTHCVQGHELAGGNVRQRGRGRICRECERAFARKYYQTNPPTRERQLEAKRLRLLSDPAHREARKQYLREYRRKKKAS